MAGFTAFREAFLSADLKDGAAFADVNSRRLRYDIYWAFYENTAYKNLHSWAVSFRQYQQLYKSVRGIYNPSYRLGEFWKSHLWGGQLDPDAGNGEETPSAIPIVTKNKTLRPAIGQLWQWSNWGINKQIAALYGSILGDVVLQVVDDPGRKKVYLDVLHPGLIKDADFDKWGNVKGYEIEEEREHPTIKDQKVTYTEIAKRDGQNVVYQTLLNGRPYPWAGEQSEWTEPYGFIPMVIIQHNNVGLDWGWSELHSGRGKFQEADDLASKLSDQIRKMVDAPWLFAGVEKPRNAPRTSGATPTVDAPGPGREEIPVLYGPPGASAHPLVAKLDIGATAQYIASILAEIERDYPELQMDIWAAGGNTSGRALRVARQRVTTKVLERRANYDDALVRAQQMAVAIGGLRGYQGFSGFGMESYQSGKLDHTIGERPVFAVDPLDDIETDSAFWSTAGIAVRAGLPLTVWLRRQGWTDKEIKDLEETPEFKARLASLEMSTMMAGNMKPGGDPDQNEPEMNTNGGDQSADTGA